MRRAFAALLGVSSVVGLAVRNTPMRRALALPMHPALALLGMGMAPLALAATDYIPCSDPCDGGDVNYHLVASVRTVPLLNYTYRGRLFSSGDGRAGGLDDDDDDGATAFLGPTLRVRPGQSLWVKLTNDLTSAPDEWGSRPPTVHNYWKMLQNPGEKIKYRYYRRTVADPSLMAVDASNMPGDFDATNLHLHGLDVEVHMFDPVNTHDPDAPHVRVKPGQCYCYRFAVPEHHPSGMYWYHPHLHGSTAVQMWGGMLGLLYVEGPLEGELANYGITNTREFVIWDPALRAVDRPTHDVEVDDFLMGQTTLSKIHPFTVNGRINPTFETATGQVLHLRVLCGTVENENTFLVYPEGREEEPWEEAAVEFWVVATDGVTHRTPRRKTVLVMAGGQRHEILLRFDRPGKYVVSQQGIQGMQFFDMYGHPHDQILATVRVRDAEDDAERRPAADIADMEFTPGYAEEEAIDARDVVKSETVVFSMGADRDRAPFPQYYVNGECGTRQRRETTRGRRSGGGELPAPARSSSLRPPPTRCERRPALRAGPPGLLRRARGGPGVRPDQRQPQRPPLPRARQPVPGEGDGLRALRGQVPRARGRPRLRSRRVAGHRDRPAQRPGPGVGALQELHRQDRLPLPLPRARGHGDDGHAVHRAAGFLPVAVEGGDRPRDAGPGRRARRRDPGTVLLVASGRRRRALPRLLGGRRHERPEVESGGLMPAVRGDYLPQIKPKCGALFGQV